jgi:DNA-binding NarL/FixJ family response regulator
MIKVMICEDIKEVREGLKFLLEMDEEIEVVSTTGKAEELFSSIEQYGPPDVVLMDIGLEGMSGLEATSLLVEKYPKVKVLILTIFEEEEKILKAIENGASGYILKNSRPEELVSQIKAVHAGGAPVSPSVAKVLLKELRKGSTTSCNEYRLTSREKEIMKALMEGLTYREIAQKFNIASSTVKKHILHIYRKMEVSNKVEFMKKAMVLNLDE